MVVYGFCINFRRLNNHTEKDSYPLPQVSEALEALQGMCHFSSLDLKDGFWQIQMSDKAQPYTTFTIRNLGFYEWNQLPFGLMNAPATFQRAMEECMGDLKFSICMVYLNDLICYSKRTLEHIKRLCRVFKQLRSNGLKLKPEKCKLFQMELMYLGHHMSKEEIRLSRDTVSAVVNSDVHNSYTGIWRFIGLVESYQKFIKGFSALVDGLYEHQPLRWNC